MIGCTHFMKEKEREKIKDLLMEEKQPCQQVNLNCILAIQVYSLNNLTEKHTEIFKHFAFKA